MEFHPLYKIPNAVQSINEYFTVHKPMAEKELLCFEDDYYYIYLDLQKRDNINSITDIGCCNGFQSLFFSNYSYIGIDAILPKGYIKTSQELIKEMMESVNFDDSIIRNNEKGIPFFNEESPNLKYFVSSFPEQFKDEMVSDCFISNMSVGYKQLHVSDTEIKNAFAKFPQGYANVPPNIELILDGIFPNKETIYHRNEKNIFFYSK